MSDIYKGELQDNEGNTIYPHTEADIVFCNDGKTMQEKITDMEASTEGVTGRTDSLEVNDSSKLATSAATYKLAQMQGGNNLIYNESEDAYYIQHGADSVPKKLGKAETIIGSSSSLKECTFDVKSLLPNDYAKLTPANFYFTDLSLTKVSGYAGAVYGGDLSISYDASTGILTVSKVMFYTVINDASNEVVINYTVKCIL